jgi:hypothetical protein
MSKIQTIIYLFVFLIVLFSVDTIFGNPLRETFTNTKLPIVSPSTIVSPSKTAKTSKTSNKKQHNEIKPSYKRQSDDQPLHFSFPF